MQALAMSLWVGLMLGDASPNWAGFRGDGSSCTTATDLPLTWSPANGVAWRKSLPGYGQSSPVVWNDRVFLTAIDGSEKETLHVVALDLHTGEPLWRKEFATSLRGKNNPMMSRAAPTPLVDSHGVYALFESGDVMALGHDGEMKWQRSLSSDYGSFKNNHGLGCSPTQTDDAVVVLIDDMGPAYLVALEKSSGKNLWKTDRKSRSSWTSPVSATIDDRTVVVVSSQGTLDVYEAKTGELLQTVEGIVGNTIPSATVQGDLIVTGAGENRMKPDRAASARSNRCFRGTFQSGTFKLEPVWEGNKAISEYASPLIHRGHVYFVTKAGLVHCLDLKTGEERYAERVDGPCWATPIGAGERVYFFGKDGVTTVLKAGAEFEKLASNRLWSVSDSAARQTEARANATDTRPNPPKEPGPGGGPAMPPKEREAARLSGVGDVVYGVAAVNGVFIVRTGTELIAIRASTPNADQP